MAKILKSQNIEEQQGNARVGGWGVTLFETLGLLMLVIRRAGEWGMASMTDQLTNEQNRDPIITTW